MCLPMHSSIHTAVTSHHREWSRQNIYITCRGPLKVVSKFVGFVGEVCWLWQCLWTTYWLNQEVTVSVSVICWVNFKRRNFWRWHSINFSRIIPICGKFWGSLCNSKLGLFLKNFDNAPPLPVIPTLFFRCYIPPYLHILASLMTENRLQKYSIWFRGFSLTCG